MIDSLHRGLAAIGKRQDLVVVILVVTAILMMILPLPTWLVDALIGLNIASAVLLLMMALYLRDPLEFSTLPSIILITTIFRLALSITTTRLILLQADAGEIIESFGQFVIAGELIVGLVVFLIITIVQFVVITKGSERVAEVAARFQLDALPGKQMSIDSDLRTGDLDAGKARLARGRLEQESRFFGAMDGAMKFVKGDAIAGLVIVAVNLIGGIAIGMTRKGMTAGEAVDVYSLLTVGDGLAAQLPALFVSLAAGSVITRVSTDRSETLGADIARQMTSSRFALRIAGVIVLLLMIVPGFPWPVFLVLGLGLLAFGYADRLRALLPREGHSVRPTSLAQRDGPCSLRIAPRIIAGGDDALVRLQTVLDRRADTVSDEVGVEIPPVRLSIGPELPSGAMRFEIDGIVAETVTLDPAQSLVIADPESLSIAGIDYREVNTPLKAPLFSVTASPDTLSDAGLSPVPPADLLVEIADTLHRRYAHESVGVPEVRAYLSEASAQHPDLVAEVRELVPMPALAEVFRRLIEEGVPLRQSRRVLAALAEWSAREKAPAVLADYVRTALDRQICEAVADERGIIAAYLLGPDVEDALRGGIRQTSAGEYLALDDDGAARLAETIKRSMRVPLHGHGQSVPVLLTSLDIRRFVRRLMVGNGMADVPVLSYLDLSSDAAVVPITTILMPKGRSAA